MNGTCYPRRFRQPYQDWMGNLPDNVRRDVHACLFPRHYAAGEVVYRTGEEGDEMFQVLSGAVRIYALSEEGKELLYDLFPAGSWFGEGSLIDGEPRAVMAQAIGDVTLSVLSQAHFERLWARYPEVSLAVARMVAARVRKLFYLYEGVSTAALSNRMAGRLCFLADAVGIEQMGGIHFDMRLTQEDIGSLVVGSRQSVNRILKQWQCDGIIDISYGTVVIKNKLYLERLAEDRS
ncbi:MAG: Crp/Fnr family transcriptional regulator [Parahaliea sp.]